MKIIKENRRLVEDPDEYADIDTNPVEQQRNNQEQTSEINIDTNDLNKLRTEYNKIGPLTDKRKIRDACDITERALTVAFNGQSKTSVKDLRTKLDDMTFSKFVNDYIQWDQLKQPNNEFINILKKFNLGTMTRDQIIDLYNKYVSGSIDNELIKSSNTLEDLVAKIRDNDQQEYKRKKNRTSDQVLNDVADELIQSHLDKQINDLKDVIKAKMDAKKNQQ